MSGNRRGYILNPRDWVSDPSMREVAIDSGWADWSRQRDNLAILAAIIMIEGHGDSRATGDSDGSTGLTQFNVRANHGLFNRSDWNDEIGSVFSEHNVVRPQLGGDRDPWFADPRASVIYSGFVLRDNLGSRPQETNLFLALQAYNGGGDARVPVPSNGTARAYPERIGAYLQYQVDNAGLSETQRAPYRDALERLRNDANAVGQLERLDAGIRRYSGEMRRREGDVPRLISGEIEPSGYRIYRDEYEPGTYLAGLIRGSAPSSSRGPILTQEDSGIDTTVRDRWARLGLGLDLSWFNDFGLTRRRSETNSVSTWHPPLLRDAAPRETEVSFSVFRNFSTLDLNNVNDRKLVQSLLEAAGLATDRGGANDNDVDGIFGGRTERAIRTVQRELGIEQTGSMDARVWGALQDTAQLTEALADSNQQTLATRFRPIIAERE